MRFLFTIILTLVLAFPFVLKGQEITFKGKKAYVDGLFYCTVEESDQDLLIKNSAGVELARFKLYTEGFLTSYFIVSFKGVYQQGEFLDGSYFRKKVVEAFIRHQILQNDNLNIPAVKKFIENYPVKHQEAALANAKDNLLIPGTVPKDLTLENASKYITEEGVVVRDRNGPISLVTNVLKQDGKQIGTFSRTRVLEGGLYVEVIAYFLTTGTQVAEVRCPINDEKHYNVKILTQNKNFQVFVENPALKIETLAKELVALGYI